MRLKFALRRGAVVFALATCITAMAANPGYGSVKSEPLHVDFGSVDFVDVAKAAFDSTRDFYFIVFDEEPLATYRGDLPGLAQAPTRISPISGRERLDVQSLQAREYVEFLQQRQASHMAQVESRLRRTVPTEWSYQLAVNAVLVSISPLEAGAIRRLSGVRRVERMETYELNTDFGPELVGAPGVWDGSAPAGGVGSRGEGAVIGVIDSGINFESPSFAAEGPLTGHVHQNPLGSAFLGTCAPGGVDEGRCNNKLVGAHDFVFAVCSLASNPCGPPGAWIDEPSAEDNGGHGTHVASTAAGNALNVALPGSAFTVAISGVAPHANIVAYDGCYTRASDGAGLCPGAATLASVEQAIADGIVDTISYSIGGGAEPWSDIVSQGFRAAHAAGILVSASAGNSGPGPFTLGHVEPWTITVGASTHSRNFYRFALDVTRGDSEAAPTDVRFAPGTGGSLLPVAGLQAPIVLSPGYAVSATVGNDGCLVEDSSPYVADQFSGEVVVIRRGGCFFTEKAANAEAAGAVGVIIANNQGATTLTAPGGTPAAGIPMVGVSENDGLAIRDAILGDAGPGPTAVDLDGVPETVLRAADVMAGFSSRGPHAFEQLKPDITAPGSLILAAYVPNPDSTNIISGTSMAQPHVSGASLLLRSLHPDWSPTAVKSALTLSSVGGVLKQDGATASDPFDRGAGRLDASRASHVGLVMDVSDAEYAAANPFEGADLAALNLPNIATWSCSGMCEFQRTVSSVRDTTVNWTASVSGVTGAVVPSSFSLAPGTSQTLTIALDGTSLVPGVFNFGAIELTPTEAGVSSATLPVAVRGGPPRLAVLPDSEVSFSLANSGTSSFAVDVSNVGNPTLAWSVVEGLASYDLLNLGQLGTGARTQFFSSFAIGQYNAQYFRVNVPTRIDVLRANGFVLPVAGSLGGENGLATAVSFAVFGNADSGPRPSGHPEGGAEPVWAFSVPLVAPDVPDGVDLTNNNIQLDLAAAGAPDLLLEPGEYWFMAYPTLPGSGTGGNVSNPLWAWRYSDSAPVGAYPVGIFPFFDADFSGRPATNFSSRIEGSAECGAAWLSYDITSGSLAFNQGTEVEVTLNAAGLPEEEVQQAQVCVSSNGGDPAAPLLAVPVTLAIDNAIFSDGFETPPPPP
jgi:hypothetical protein